MEDNLQEILDQVDYPQIPIPELDIDLALAEVALTLEELGYQQTDNKDAKQ